MFRRPFDKRSRMNSILTLDNVSMTYYTKKTRTEAIKNLSFDVKQGEFISVLGPSGCGKTTLLSLISGTLRPTSGRILLDGAEITGTSTDVGYMLQRDHLFEWRTIYKNITLGLEIQHKKSKENLEHCDRLIEDYGLKDFVRHYPSQLSGGMRQRVALIRTLALSPKVLLLDEPFSALDFQTRLHVCDDVYAIIKKEGITAVLVTHDISEAISMSDRIAILTARPATLKRMHQVGLGHIATPLMRREAPSFSAQFETLWKEVAADG